MNYGIFLQKSSKYIGVKQALATQIVYGSHETELCRPDGTTTWLVFVKTCYSLTSLPKHGLDTSVPMSSVQFHVKLLFRIV